MAGGRDTCVGVWTGNEGQEIVQLKQVMTRSSAGGRAINEDAVLHMAAVPLLAVADGMGGANCGDVAAEIAFDCLRLHRSFLREECGRINTQRTSRSRLNVHLLLEVAFKLAHANISQQAQDEQRRRMATTLLAVVVADDHAYISHVGNCRGYVMRGGTLHTITQDHTVAAARRSFQQVAINAAEERRLLQVLGSGSVDVDLAEVPLADDDVLLLCTDGLTQPLTDEQIQALISPDDLEGSADALLAAAEENGSDNVAFALAKVGSGQARDTVEDVAELMRSVFLFSALSTAERYLLAPFLEERSYQTGDVIIREGVMGAEFYVIIEGTVRITRDDVHLVDVGAGGHLGELTLARPGLRSATVTAVEPVRVYALSRERFLQVTERRPALGAQLSMALLDTVGERLRDLTDRLAKTEQLVQSAPEDTGAILAAIRGHKD